MVCFIIIIFTSLLLCVIKYFSYGKNQTCSQDRQCQDQDQDRKWQYETKCTQFTQKLLLSKTSMTLIDVKFTTEYCI